MTDIPEAIQLVGNSEQRMAKQHPRTGVPHDVPGLDFSGRLVAVNGTIGASWLVITIGTFFQPYLSIVEKLLTLCAQHDAQAVMVRRAIDVVKRSRTRRFLFDCIPIPSADSRIRLTTGTRVFDSGFPMF
jgi:hypothetical protein